MPKGIKGFQKGHPTYCLKHTPEAKKKISMAHNGMKKPWSRKSVNLFKIGKTPWNKGKRGIHFSSGTEFIKGQKSKHWNGWHKGHTPWNKGLSMPEEQKQRLREKTLQYYKEHPEKIEVIRQKRLEQIFPIHDTSIEIKIQEALREKGIEFTKHKRLLGKYQVDIFIEPNIIIEADGDYWHNLPNIKKRDEIRNKDLMDNGFVVYRFWEHQIKENIEQCLNPLNQLLGKN